MPQTQMRPHTNFNASCAKQQNCMHNYRITKTHLATYTAAMQNYMQILCN